MDKPLGEEGDVTVEPHKNQTSNKTTREEYIPPGVRMNLFFPLFLASFYVALAGAPQCATKNFMREGK